MATKPTDTGEFATNAVYATGPATGDDNKVVPDAGHKTDGHLPDEFPTAEFLNWLENNSHLWKKWIDENVIDNINAQTVGGAKTFTDMALIQHSLASTLLRALSGTEGDAIGVNEYRDVLLPEVAHDSEVLGAKLETVNAKQYRYALAIGAKYDPAGGAANEGNWTASTTSAGRKPIIIAFNDTLAQWVLFVANDESDVVSDLFEADTGGDGIAFVTNNLDQPFAFDAKQGKVITGTPIDIGSKTAVPFTIRDLLSGGTDGSHFTININAELPEHRSDVVTARVYNWVVAANMVWDSAASEWVTKDSGKDCYAIGIGRIGSATTAEDTFVISHIPNDELSVDGESHAVTESIWLTMLAYRIGEIRTGGASPTTAAGGNRFMGGGAVGVNPDSAESNVGGAFIEDGGSVNPDGSIVDRDEVWLANKIQNNASHIGVDVRDLTIENDTTVEITQNNFAVALIKVHGNLILKGRFRVRYGRADGLNSIRRSNFGEKGGVGVSSAAPGGGSGGGGGSGMWNSGGPGGDGNSPGAAGGDVRVENTNFSMDSAQVRRAITTAAKHGWRNLAALSASNMGVAAWNGGFGGDGATPLEGGEGGDAGACVILVVSGDIIIDTPVGVGFPQFSVNGEPGDFGIVVAGTPGAGGGGGGGGLLAIYHGGRLIDNDVTPQPVDDETGQLINHFDASGAKGGDSIGVSSNGSAGGGGGGGGIVAICSQDADLILAISTANGGAGGLKNPPAGIPTDGSPGLSGAIFANKTIPKLLRG